MLPYQFPTPPGLWVSLGEKIHPLSYDNQLQPRCSIYGIFTYIYHTYMINVGKYSNSIHGASGLELVFVEAHLVDTSSIFLTHKKPRFTLKSFSIGALPCWQGIISTAELISLMRLLSPKRESAYLNKQLFPWYVYLKIPKSTTLPKWMVRIRSFLLGA